MKELNSFDENTTTIELLSTKKTINPSNHTDQMAMQLAHEVRNPLTTIKGFLQLLKQELKDEKKAEYVDIAVDEIDRSKPNPQSLFKPIKTTLYHPKRKCFYQFTRDQYLQII